MADAAALDVHLHPLVLINISDHVVRFDVSGRTQRVLGALLGAQEGRRIDVHNSFELLLSDGDADGGAEGSASAAGGAAAPALALDLEFFQQRLAQYLEVFPKYEFLGWYSTGKAPEEADKTLHKRIQEASANENPFLLLVDVDEMRAQKASKSEELPVKVFDATAHLEGGALRVDWSEVPFAIDTLEAERIAVNLVAKTATAAAAGHSSDFTQHTSGLANSVVMLNNRVKELLEYMKDVKAQKVPKNHDVLRQMLSICQAMQATHQDSLRQELSGEFSDAALIVLLASLTKACASTSDLLDKFQLAHDKQLRQRHHYPFG